MSISSQVHKALLLKQIKVIDQHSAHNGENVDIHIVDGVIETIGKNIEVSNVTIIDGADLCVSPGWFDYGVYGGTPGLELIERRESLIQAACAGGFTRIAVWPEAIPYADHASAIEHIQGSHKVTGLRIDVIGALSKCGAGEELAEVLNMNDQGIVAISDGHKNTPDNNILRKALQYCAPLNIPVIVVPKNPELSYGNGIHEGLTSTQLGLKGDPTVGEVSAIQQSINLAEYTRGNLLLHLISSSDSVETLKKSKAKINASVSGFHLCHTEQDLKHYNSFFKLEPPLRTKSDQLALREAVADGNIKSIVSDHRPRDMESWNVEYMRALPGQSALEIIYSACETHTDEILTTEHIVRALSHGNREVLNLASPEIRTGTTAELTIFNPNQEWPIDQLHSDGKNSAYIGKMLRGKVYGTIIKNQLNIIN